MKSKFLYIALGAVALFTASCSEEELATAGIETSQGVLRATVEQTPGTRVGFGTPNATTEVAAFYWSEDDKIGTTSITSINGKSVESTTFSTLMTLTAGAGAANGVFSGALSGSLGNYALYPYSEENKEVNKIESGTLTYVFPASYTYTKLDADFYEETNSGKLQSYNAAMLGKISGGNVNFKHLGGVFCIQVPNPGTSGKLVLTANQKINGTFTATVSDANPQLQTAATDVEAEKSVTINYTNSEASQTTGVFYIPVPVGTYDVTISVYDGDNKLINSGGESNVSIARADLYGIRLGDVQNITTEKAFRRAILGTAPTIYVTGDIDVTSEKVYVPREVTINVAEGVTITAKACNGDGNIFINGGKLTLTGSGKISGKHLPIEVGLNSTLNIDGVTIEATTVEDSKSTAIYVNRNSTVNLKSGLVKSALTGIYSYSTVNVSGGKVDAVGYAIQNRGGTLEMSGGEIVQNTHGNSKYKAIYINGGTFTCTGGKVDAQESAVYAEENVATINISGGEFYGRCQVGNEHYVYTINLVKSAGSTSTLNISGDTYVQGTYGCINVKAGDTTIDGGTFVVVDSSCSYYALYGENTVNSVTVNGGNFYATKVGRDVYDVTGGKMTFNGGNFKNNTYYPDLVITPSSGYKLVEKTQTIGELVYNYSIVKVTDATE
jgi:hypothetical protein